MVADLFAGVVLIADPCTIQTTQTPRRCELTADPLRLLWEFSQDRWRHICYLRQGEIWKPLLESVEGTPEDDFPPSPVFQELLLDQKQADRHEIQLLGRSGKILFAAAVTLDARNQTVDYDVSARLSGGKPPARLLSTYAVSGCRIQNQNAVLGEGNGTQMALTAVRTEDSPVCEISATESGYLQIRCADRNSAASDQQGETFRWRYRIIGGDDA